MTYRLSMLIHRRDSVRGNSYRRGARGSPLKEDSCKRSDFAAYRRAMMTYRRDTVAMTGQAENVFIVSEEQVTTNQKQLP